VQTEEHERSRCPGGTAKTPVGEMFARLVVESEALKREKGHAGGGKKNCLPRVRSLGHGTNQKDLQSDIGHEKGGSKKGPITKKRKKGRSEVAGAGVHQGKGAGLAIVLGVDPVREWVKGDKAIKSRQEARAAPDAKPDRYKESRAVWQGNSEGVFPAMTPGGGEKSIHCPTRGEILCISKEECHVLQKKGGGNCEKTKV